MTKKENVLEKCRINLDNEKTQHSITRIQRDKYKARIDKAIEYNDYFKKSVKEQLDLKQDYSVIIASYIGAFHDTLEEILKGEDK